MAFVYLNGSGHKIDLNRVFNASMAFCVSEDERMELSGVGFGPTGLSSWVRPSAGAPAVVAFEQVTIAKLLR